MPRTQEQLREDALAIWRAAVAAVDSRRLVRENMLVEQGVLHVAGEEIELAGVERIVVVGGGKAGAGMAAGVEEALGPSLMAEKNVAGWVNVPANCVGELSRITLHAARPAGVNEPTEDGIEGTRRILSLVRSLSPRDLCLCLLSGGGSALLPAPVEGITLSDKQQVTRFLSGAGANIEELNAVRKPLSRIKGGGLARACRAGRLAALIISDVLGDPLDVIASGPTAAGSSGPREALAVLEKFGARAGGVGEAVLATLSRQAALQESTQHSPSCRVTNHIIGNNAVAVDAAGQEAERRGYRHALHSAVRPEGPAEEVGRRLAEMALSMRAADGPDCLITGGEPIVRLIDEAIRGKGGRNQQLVLAALLRLMEEKDSNSHDSPLAGVALLSGGTDGEDGPTDAAGAFIDEQVADAAAAAGLDAAEFLRRNDAWTFFNAAGGLIRTGPTHTNVCDVRVVLTHFSAAPR